LQISVTLSNQRTVVQRITKCKDITWSASESRLGCSALLNLRTE